MGAAHHDRDLRPTLREPAGDVPADRTGAENADLQDSISIAARDSACTPRPMQASSG